MPVFASFFAIFDASFLHLEWITIGRVFRVEMDYLEARLTSEASF